MARKPDEQDTLYLPTNVSYRPLPDDIRLSAPRYFPPPTATTVDGLVCVGGRLSPDWLIDAYSHGIFPWPMWEDEPIAWWSPDPRSIIELDGLHISRRLRRRLRRGEFSVTCDRHFDGVIGNCATGAGREGGTWLTPAMIAAYRRMHELGHAHSVEVWLPRGLSPFAESSEQKGTVPLSADGSGKGSNSRGEEMILVGGTYGITIGGLFAAESMFYRVRDASKVALAHLVAHLHARGFHLLDIQQLTPHTASLGAVEISRTEYLRRLARAIQLPVTFGSALEGNPLDASTQ